MGGAAIYGVVIGRCNSRRADALEAMMRDQPNFNPADVYVSATNGAGIAIDRERKEVMLADRQGIRRFGIKSIVGCEVLQDDVQLAYTNRGSQIAGVAAGGVLLGGVGAVIGGLSGSRRSVNNVFKVVLRITTDDFDKPHHDIVLVDWGFSKNGLDKKRADLPEST